jgi:hypothetical protein
MQGESWIAAREHKEHKKREKRGAASGFLIHLWDDGITGCSHSVFLLCSLGSFAADSTAAISGFGETGPTR